MNNYIKGYENDAGVDIVLDDNIIIRPGYNEIELPAIYTPGKGEVAFLVARGSTAKKGIFPIPVAIDTDYDGPIHAFIINTSDRTYAFGPGERICGIVNLKLGEDRVSYKIAKSGNRGANWNNSSGGNK